MVRGRSAYFAIARRWLGPPGRSVALLLLGACVHVNVAAAAETGDCASIGLGRLDVVRSGTLFTVEVNEGDTLTFAFPEDARATGTVALVAGDRVEQRLPYGPDAAQVSYTAERSDALGVRLATKAGEGATLVTTCNPAHGSSTIAAGRLDADMSMPSASGATAWKGIAPAIPDASNLQWLGRQQPAEDATAAVYGVNLRLQPAFTVGVLAQFDPAPDPLLGPTALSDQPWMAGPVTSLQLGGGILLDARAAWGSADPVLGHAADRQTLDAHLTSKQEVGAWRFSPSIGFAQVLAKSGTTVDAQLATVPGPQAVESDRVEVKPEVAYRFDMGESVFMEPKLMVGTFWNLGDASTIGTATGAQHEPRHMAETGITFGSGDGTKLQVGGSVEEGETPSENVWSGKVQLSIPLR